MPYQFRRQGGAQEGEARTGEAGGQQWAATANGLTQQSTGEQEGSTEHGPSTNRKSTEQHLKTSEHTQTRSDLLRREQDVL